jgi:hypothetical protein
METDVAMGNLYSELLTMATYDTMEALTPSEVAALERELGRDWRTQLLTPISQPMTLRNGTILGQGGGKRGGDSCPFALRVVARILLLSLVSLCLMSALAPYVPSAVAAANPYWVAAQGYAADVAGLAMECPIGIGVPVWKNTMCSQYGLVLRRLQSDMLDTVRQMMGILRDAKSLAAFGMLTLGQVYAFARNLVRTGDGVIIASLDAICTLLRSVGWKRAPAATSASTAGPATTVTLTLDPDQLATLQQLLLLSATQFKVQGKQDGGAFAWPRKTRRTAKKKAAETKSRR